MSLRTDFSTATTALSTRVASFEASNAIEAELELGKYLNSYIQIPLALDS